MKRFYGLLTVMLKGGSARYAGEITRVKGEALLRSRPLVGAAQRGGRFRFGFIFPLQLK
jgi:hypothetical protein